MQNLESEFDKALAKLCEILGATEDDEERISLAFYSILEIVYQSSGSHFEMLGLLSEAQMTLREQSLEDMEREGDSGRSWHGGLSGEN